MPALGPRKATSGPKNRALWPSNGYAEPLEAVWLRPDPGRSVLLLVARDDQAAVLPTKPEAVLDKHADVRAARFVRHVVEVACRVRVLEIDRRVDLPRLDRFHRGDRLHRPARCQPMPDEALRRADRQLVGALTKHPL